MPADSPNFFHIRWSGRDKAITFLVCGIWNGKYFVLVGCTCISQDNQSAPSTDDGATNISKGLHVCTHHKTITLMMLPQLVAKRFQSK